MSKKILLTVLLAVGLQWLLATRITVASPVDDAYISYHYALNWADGHGPVINPGERVEGYSNFLQVALLAGAEVLGISPPLAARSLNFLSVLALIFLLCHRLQRRHGWWAAMIACAFMALGRNTVENILMGLESPLAALLLLAGTFALVDRKGWTVPVCFLLLTLTRPEGAVLALVAGLLEISGPLWRRDWLTARRVLRRWLIFAALPLALFMAWRFSYYSAWLPNSVLAKRGFPLQRTVSESWSYIHSWYTMYWPAVILAFSGLVISALVSSGLASNSLLDRRSLRRREEVPILTPLILALFGVCLLIGGSDPYEKYHRYLYPALPLLLLSAVIGACQWWTVARGKARWLNAALVCGLALIQAGLLWPPVQQSRIEEAPAARLSNGLAMMWAQDREPHQQVRRVPSVLHSVAKWLADNAEPDAVVATAEVGIVPYYGRLRVLDTAGLVDAHIAKLAGGPGFKSDADYVFGRQPDYFVFRKRVKCMCSGIPADVGYFRDPRLRRRYDFVRFFQEGQTTLLLFRKRQKPREADPLLDFVAETIPDHHIVFVNMDGSEHRGPELEQANTGTRQANRILGVRKANLKEMFQLAQRTEQKDFELTEEMNEWLSQWGYKLQAAPAAKGTKTDFRYDIVVPENAALSFGFGIVQDERNAGNGAAVRFQIIVRANGIAVPLLDRYLDTEVRAEEVGWHFQEVDLSPFAGRPVNLTFRVEPDVVPGRRLRASGWFDPQIIRQGRPVAKAGATTDVPSG